MSLSSGELRILYCGSVVPVRTWHGGAPLLWRHFSAAAKSIKFHCYLSDFARGSGVESEFACSFAPPEPPWLKLRRYSPAGFSVLTNIWLHRLEGALDRIIRDFQPDVLLGIWVPDDFLWLTDRVARKHKVPRSLILHDVHALDRYRFATQRAAEWTWQQLEFSDQLLAVSQGMLELCAERSPADLRLLYPIPEELARVEKKPSQNGKFRLAYFGSVHQSYAKPFLALSKAINVSNWEISVTWLGDRVVKPQVERIISVKDLGWLQISHLAELAAETDIFLVIQSFEECDRATTSVNFQSKLTQLAQFGKAVLVIAPPWSSISKWANEKRKSTDSIGVVELVETCEVDEIRNALQRLEKLDYRRALGESLLAAYRQDFQPAYLQHVFEKSLVDLSRSHPKTG